MTFIQGGAMLFNMKICLRGATNLSPNHIKCFSCIVTVLSNFIFFFVQI